MPVPDRVSSAEHLPAKTDVVIIGGGIIGVSAALELAEQGISVVLCEKHEIACEQSSRNWGWCRQMGRDPRELPLIAKSLDLWRGMNARIGAETGYRQPGILYLAKTAEEAAKRQAWLKIAGNNKVAARVIGSNEAATLMPGASVRWDSALYTPTDGRAEPQLAAPAIARGAAKAGATILTHCAVRGIEKTGGRVSGVVTERGPIACQGVLLAGGAWSRKFARNLGIPLPQLGFVNSVLRTAPIDAGFECAGAAAEFAIRKRLDGGFTVAHRHLSVADIVPDSFRLLPAFWPALKLDWQGLKLRFGRGFMEEARLPRRWRLDQQSPMEMIRVLNPLPVEPILDAAFESLKAHFPKFEGARIAERWAGLIDATPDSVPIISSVEQVPGFFLATGFSGHGFGLGPGAGRLAADLITGQPPIVDPAPFRYSRFFDGSRPRPMTGL